MSSPDDPQEKEPGGMVNKLIRKADEKASEDKIKKSLKIEEPRSLAKTKPKRISHNIKV